MRKVLLIALAILLTCGAACAATVQYTFKPSELNAMSALTDYADTDCADDYATIAAYINGKKGVTKAQATAALENIQAFDASARESAAAIRTTISAKLSESETEYVINYESKVFHEPSCHSAKSIKKAPHATVRATYQELIDEGYKPCGHCIP